MRVDNVKVTMDIPVHFNQPDKNGYVYTKESWEEVVKNAVGIPIEIIHNDGTRTVVGVTQDVQLVKEEEEKRIKYQEKISKAEDVNIKDIDSDMWFYDEQTDDYFSDIDCFVDAYKDSDEYEFDEDMMTNLPEVLWLTDSVDISMDADSIIESACEELHEDAYENISGSDRKELQNMLDEWCSKQTGTRTVYPNYKKYVRVRKEWFE